MRLKTLLFSILFSLAMAVLTRYATVLILAENWVGDFKTAYFQQESPTHPDIVILKITEETLSSFPYRSPVDRRFLADTLSMLERHQVRGVFVDILIDQPTEADKDAALKSVIDEYRRPLVFSYADDAMLLSERQITYMSAFIPPEVRGLANLVKDDRDGIVREIYVTEGARQSLAEAFVNNFGLSYELSKRPAIRWYGSPQQEAPLFKEYAIHLLSQLPSAWFKDKLVLIGADLPFQDRHKTPFIGLYGLDTGSFPGVRIHAHMLSQLLAGTSVKEIPPWVSWILLFGAVIGFFWLGGSRRLWFKFLTAGVVLIGYAAAVFFFFNRFAADLPLVSPILTALVSFALGVFLLGRRLSAEKAFIRDAFSKYLAPSVVSLIEEDPSLLKLGGQRKEVAVLFTDIAGFTSFSENVTPEVLNEWLGRYLSGMSDIILKYEGTIDKYIGDAIVAFFGAPLDQPDHSRRAVLCVQELSVFARKFVVEANERGIPFGITRMGLHSGSVVVGNFGSADRFDYTVIGDTVNTAARLESVNKYLGTSVCVSGAVVEKFSDFPWRPIGRLALKGKNEFLTVYEPLAPQSTPALHREEYMAAYEQMASGEKEAADLFALLHERCTEDELVRFHLNRLQSGATGIEIRLEEK